jgi:predicted PurR-regulated permease PerM
LGREAASIRLTTAAQLVNNLEVAKCRRTLTFCRARRRRIRFRAIVQRRPVITREQIVTIFLLLALAGFLVLVARLLLPYAGPVAWAAVLGVVFYPAYGALCALIPRSPNLTAGIMTVLVFSVVVVPSLLLTSILAREAIEGYQHLRDYLSADRLDALDALTHHWVIAPVWNWIRERLATGDVNPTSLLLSVGQWGSEQLVSRATAIARNVVSFLIGLSIMLFTLFFAFRDGRVLIRSAEELLPMAADDRRRLISRLQQTILAVVQGLTVTAALQGVLVAFGLWAVGMNFAVLLGTAAFFLAFLPIGGAAIIWIPTTIGLLVTGEWARGMAFGVYSMLVVSSVDNLIRPIVIGSQAQLSTPILFFGILGGLQAYGFIGLFLGPAILATFSVLVGMYRERFLVEQPLVVAPAAASAPADVPAPGDR